MKSKCKNCSKTRKEHEYEELMCPPSVKYLTRIIFEDYVKEEPITYYERSRKYKRVSK